jgi:hypothetical protein
MAKIESTQLLPHIGGNKTVGPQMTVEQRTQAVAFGGLKRFVPSVDAGGSPSELGQQLARHVRPGAEREERA